MYTDSVELVQGQTLANKVSIQFLVREELTLLPINRKNEDVCGLRTWHSSHIYQRSYYCLTHLDTVLDTIRELLTRFADGSKKGNNSQTLFAIDN